MKPYSLGFVMWNHWQRRTEELWVIAESLTAGYAFRDRIFPASYGWETAKIRFQPLEGDPS